MSSVLFVCLHNAGRSQMSEAFFNKLAVDRGHESRSAGTEPAGDLHEVVVDAMAEAGYDLTGKRPKMITKEMAEWADVVVTMGCGESCPYLPGKHYIDWQLKDPSSLSLNEVRAVRDEISTRVLELIDELERVG